MSTRLHVVMPDELVARIDEVLGPGQPRADFIRRAVEQALGKREPEVPIPAPAERPLGLAIQQAARSSSQAKRGVEPRPKGKR